MSAIKLMIADRSKAFTELVISYLGNRPEIDVIGSCKSGAELIRQTQRHSPDAVLMDIILENIDGIGVLKRLQPQTRKTAFIICTEFHNDISVHLTHKYGARSFLCKPVACDVLLDNIRECTNATSSVIPEATLSSAEHERAERSITSTLLEMGISRQWEGFALIRQAVEFAIADPSLMDSMTKRLYPKLASHFTSSLDCVERNIRTAISKAYSRGTLNICGHRPTNREMIRMVVKSVTNSTYKI